RSNRIQIVLIKLLPAFAYGFEFVLAVIFFETIKHRINILQTHRLESKRERRGTSRRVSKKWIVVGSKIISIVVVAADFAFRVSKVQHVPLTRAVASNTPLIPPAEVPETISTTTRVGAGPPFDPLAGAALLSS